MDEIELPEECTLDQASWRCITNLINQSISASIQSSVKAEFDKLDIPAKVDASVKQYFSDLDSRVKGLERDVSAIKDMQGKVTSIEDSLVSYSKSVESVQKQTLPSLVDHLNCAVTALAINDLDTNMHRRKFTLVVQGVKGKKGESAEETRTKLINTVKSTMGITAVESDFSACHRLDNSRDNSGIHARFVDLSKRDLWLSNARKLAKIPKKDSISLSVDVPPCLRKVRKELADIRKDLPPPEKKASYIRHLPTYPYFELVTRGDNQINQITKHGWSKQEIALASLPAMMAECASLNYNIPVI